MSRAPLLEKDVDLRDFPYMPIDIVRLFGSEFHALSDDTIWRAGMTLWLKSYHQVPAGSISGNDLALARLVEVDVEKWTKIRKAALRGWVKCTDGRFYHPVVCEKVLEAWIEKLAQRKSSSAGNAKRYNHKFEPAPFDDAIEGAKRHLEKLNPRSKVLAKKSPKYSPSAPDAEDQDSRQAPDGSPDSNPDEFPNRSQEKGREGKGRDLSLETEIEETESLPVRAERAPRNVYPPGFLALWEAYPTDKNMSKKEAFQVWKRLPQRERDDALKAAPAYVAYCRSKPKYQPAHLCNWLEKGRAEGFLDAAEAIATATQFHAKPGMYQWDAWTEHRGKTPPVDDKGGWYFPTEWPPGHQHAQAAE